MAKQTLLELTQDILSDMTSDEVNSINDTVESLQVAQIIKSTFFNIVSGKDYPHQNQLITLEASGTSLKPNYMRLPEGVLELSTLKYNKKRSTDTRDKYETVTYVTPEAFLEKTDANVSSNSNVMKVTDFTGVPVYIRNDMPPSFCTSFDDEWLVFDSYDSSVDTTLQSSKTQCFGKVQPSFTMLDSFIPDLPVSLFPYLLNESKSTCFLVLKQMSNQKAEQHSISQRRRMSQEAWRLQRGIQRPDYGRKSKK